VRLTGLKLIHCEPCNAQSKSHVSLGFPFLFRDSASLEEYASLSWRTWPV